MGKSLRRTRGKAAGAQLGTEPTNRIIANVGTILALPLHIPVLGGVEGKARCRRKAPGWDGVLVVVRGRENRLHGEGGQQFRSRGMEDQEVAGEYRRFVA
jgi:hypothetical protein